MKRKKKLMKKSKVKEKSGLFGSLTEGESIPFPPGIMSFEAPKPKMSLVGIFRFEREKVVELESIGAKIKFKNHSHKHCRPGQQSPLICFFTIELEGEEPTDERYSLYPKESKVFATEGASKTISFEIVEYVYDDFMELKVSVEESFFEEVQKMRRENEEFKKGVSVLPYHMTLLIFENYELEFREDYEKKDMKKLFFGYFCTDITRKIFHIFTSIKYQQWVDRKYMPFSGIKNLNHFYNQGLGSSSVEKLREMKSLKSIRHVWIDNLEPWQVLLGGDVPTLRKIHDVTLGKAVPFEKMIETLNKSKNQLEEVEIDVNLSTEDYEKIVTPLAEINLEIPQLAVLKIGRFPLENIFSSKVMKSLKVIRISNWRVSGSQMESIFVNTSLRKLELVSCNLEVVDAGWMEKIFNVRDLRHLSFSYSRNLNKSCRFKINENIKLEILEMQESGTVSQAFVECLCTKLEGLKRVNFTKNRLSADCSDVMLKENCVWKKTTKIILGYRSDHEDGFYISGLRSKFDVQCW